MSTIHTLKKGLTLLIAILTLTVSYGQNTSGTVTYEQKINIHKNLPLEMEGMKDRIPEFRTTNHKLSFDTDKVAYEQVKREETDNDSSNRRRRGRGGRFGSRDGGKRFANLSTNTVVATRDLMGKKFLVKGEPTDYKWKMTGKSKQVGSYLCQEATWQDSTTQIVAWFTPMIPVQAGPGDYTGLPGLILHMDIDDGEREITATDIQLGSVDAAVLVEPTEGEEVTQEEWEAIRDEKMEEMKKEFGGKGRGRGMFRRG